MYHQYQILKAKYCLTWLWPETHLETGLRSAERCDKRQRGYLGIFYLVKVFSGLSELQHSLRSDFKLYLREDIGDQSHLITGEISFVSTRTSKNMICKLHTSPWVRSPVTKELAEVKLSGRYLSTPTQPDKLPSLMQMILQGNENCRTQLEVSDWVKYNHILGNTPDLMIHS